MIKDEIRKELNILLNNGNPRICDLDRIDKLTNMLDDGEEEQDGGTQKR